LPEDFVRLEVFDDELGEVAAACFIAGLYIVGELSVLAPSDGIETLYD
jgi:hypothetical protein